MESKKPLVVISIIYTCITVFFSSLPTSGAGAPTFNPSGEFLHFAAYALYAALIFITASRFVSFKKSIKVALLLAAALGASTEIIQLFVPGRFCDIVDWLIDLAGAAIALVVIILLNGKTRAVRK